MRKNFLVLLIALGAIFGSGTTAFAEGNGENNAAITAWKAENKAKLDAYKAAIDNYLAAKTANEAARKAIAAKFKTDADALRANTKAAVDSAATTEAKKAATKAGKEALEKLIAAISAASCKGFFLSSSRSKSLRSNSANFASYVFSTISAFRSPISFISPKTTLFSCASFALAAGLSCAPGVPFNMIR